MKAASQAEYVSDVLFLIFFKTYTTATKPHVMAHQEKEIAAWELKPEWLTSLLPYGEHVRGNLLQFRGVRRCLLSTLWRCVLKLSQLSIPRKMIDQAKMENSIKRPKQEDKVILSQGDVLELKVSRDVNEVGRKGTIFFFIDYFDCGDDEFEKIARLSQMDMCCRIYGRELIVDQFSLHMGQSGNRVFQVW